LGRGPEYERTKTASRLLLDGAVQLLIVTGREPGPGDSAESLRARPATSGGRCGRRGGQPEGAGSGQKPSTE